MKAKQRKRKLKAAQRRQARFRMRRTKNQGSETVVDKSGWQRILNIASRFRLRWQKENPQPPRPGFSPKARGFVHDF